MTQSFRSQRYERIITSFPKIISNKRTGSTQNMFVRISHLVILTASGFRNLILRFPPVNEIKPTDLSIIIGTKFLFCLYYETFGIKFRTLLQHHSIVRTRPRVREVQRHSGLKQVCRKLRLPACHKIFPCAIGCDSGAA